MSDPHAKGFKIGTGGLVAAVAALLVLILFTSPAESAEPRSPCNIKPEWKYEHFLPTIRRKVAIQILLPTPAEVDRLCGKDAAGCALKSAAEPPEPWIVILRRMPRDFNDREWLCILGHEVMHTLGAQHDTILGSPPIRSQLFD